MLKGYIITKRNMNVVIKLMPIGKMRLSNVKRLQKHYIVTRSDIDVLISKIMSAHGENESL